MRSRDFTSVHESPGSIYEIIERIPIKFGIEALH
jgi:hypothetical protein